MTHHSTHRLVLSALFASLCTVMTLVIQIPSPMQGYLNLGDCAVLLSAWTLGPVYGALAAGLGSMLADILSGYAHYAPGTLIIKFAMGAVAGSIFLGLRKLSPNRPLLAHCVSGLAAECIMVCGYFVYASLLLGRGLAAAASIPGNIVQGVFGLAAAVAAYAIVSKSGPLSQTR